MTENRPQDHAAHNEGSPIDYSFLGDPEAQAALGGGEEAYQTYINGKLDEMGVQLYATQGPGAYERFLRQRHAKSAIGDTAVRNAASAKDSPSNNRQSEASPPQPRAETLGDTPAAEGIFNGVYQALTYGIRDKTERKQFKNGQEVIVTINPSAEFADHYFERARNTVAPLNRIIPVAQFRDTFMQEADTAAKMSYRNDPGRIPERIDRAKGIVDGFLGRAKQMVRDGQTDNLTAKLFLNRIEDANVFATGYNKVTEKIDETMPSKEIATRYTRTIPKLLADNPDTKHQDTGPFIHVNASRESRRDSVGRYYISPRLNGQPERVVQIWTDTLREMGLDKELYYKVSEGVMRRYDMVIAYASSEPGNKEKMASAIDAFSKRCPPELLSQTTLPTGIEIVPGVAKTPEPTELNKLLRYRGKPAVSYNQFVCAMTDLALRRASYDFIQNGKRPRDIQFEDLEAAAKPYFAQLVALSGIDPITMENLV